MNAETSEPDQPVHDGVQNDTDPVSREPVSSPTSGASPSDGHVPVPEAGAREALEPGSEVPPGPAEEHNRASADDRGLTTEVAPSD